MIQVSIPATVLLKEFDYNAEVEIINPVDLILEKESNWMININ